MHYSNLRLKAFFSPRIWIVLAYVVAVCGVVFGIVFFGWTKMWSALQIPTMVPPFADMRTVQGGLVSIAAGYDPQIVNPGDPWGRPMNYPLLWLTIGDLFDFNHELNFLLFVTIYIVAYVVCCVKILKDYPSVWMLFALSSGAALLAIERGNNDIFIFCLVYLGLSASSVFFRSLLLAVAALLKIYPIVLVCVVWENKKMLVAGLLFAVCFFVGFYEDILKISVATPVGVEISYGAPSLAAVIRRFTTGVVPHFLISSLLLAVAAFAYVRLIPGGGECKAEDCRARQYFLVGSAIYLFTFVFSSNWDYRLIFLSLCVPHLLSLRASLVRICSLVSLVVAANQIALVAVFGVFGFGVNLIAKCFLFIMVSVFFLHEMRKMARSFLPQSLHILPS